jgi:hypothetical protein
MQSRITEDMRTTPKLWGPPHEAQEAYTNSSLACMDNDYLTNVEFKPAFLPRDKISR